MATSPAHSLEIWHRRKYGTASDPRPYDQRTPGGLLLEHYLDLAVELRNLEALVEDPGDEEVDERAMARANKRIGELRAVLVEGEPDEDPWFYEGDGEGEDVDLEEFRNTILRPESFL